jgi:dTDP-4-amino-4,6-dideoxygalactose transaminase
MSSQNNSIPFNKPYFTGKEIKYIAEAFQSKKISGDGSFTQKCHEFLEKKYGFKKVFLTTSCTDAIELAALLIDIQSGDEVICPSYTFVSTVNPFILRGAKIIFADSEEFSPNIDASKLEKLITPRTRAIVPVHYGGVACDMDTIMRLAHKYNLFVIEDAAQAIDAYYKNKPLGSIGHIAAFSFHETKNIVSGEGGMIVINDERFIKRAEILREKGTNRSAFFRGEVDKYGWVDLGSSFLPSEIVAAFLYAQLEELDIIQNRRKQIWDNYYKALCSLAEKGFFKLPVIPDYASNNGHVLYLVCKNVEQRSALIHHLKSHHIYPVFHYLSLHKSSYYSNQYVGPELINADNYTDCLVRLPLYFELLDEDVERIVLQIRKFYENL